MFTHREPATPAQDERNDCRYDRPVRTYHQLSARIGHRSLRLPLRLLHGGRDEFSPEKGAADPRRTRPGVQRLYQARGYETAADRRRAAGAARHYDAVPFARAAYQDRRARRADLDDQWQPTR